MACLLTEAVIRSVTSPFIKPVSLKDILSTAIYLTLLLHTLRPLICSALHFHSVLTSTSLTAINRFTPDHFLKVNCC